MTHAIAFFMISPKNGCESDRPEISGRTAKCPGL
jgi:hypothetical protein